MKQFIDSALQLAPSSPTSTGDSTPKLDGNTVTYLSLARLLKHKVSFYAFMSHLIKEFSSENLLCILECCQFKDYIKKINDKKTMEIEEPENLETLTSKSLEMEAKYTSF